MQRRRRQVAVAVALAVTVLAVVGVSFTPGSAAAHGAMMSPGSRTYLCWRDGLTPQGNIVPKNPACAAATDQSGLNPLYNWFGVLRSDGGGRTRGYIPDGQLCSGGNNTYAGWDLARDDWPVTHLSAGGDFSWSYSNWAHHPGTFSLYVTRDSWSPTRPLAWDDLEAEPFLSVTDPAQQGAVGSNDGHYYWPGALPKNKSGRHLIYSVWTRSDSQETFYGCSDVVFDGGNGEVTGISDGAVPAPTTTASPTATASPTTTASPTASPSPTATTTAHPTTGTGPCRVMYTVTASWDGGFQGEVMVHAGAAAVNGWTVRWTFPGRQTVRELWNGTHTQSGSQVTVAAADWNRAVAANGYVTFGFNGIGTTPAKLDDFSCTTP